jgi:hypothetical protein
MDYKERQEVIASSPISLTIRDVSIKWLVFYI